MTRPLVLLLALASLTSACADKAAERAAAVARTCADPDARVAVERLGERMKEVSLLAPDSILTREIHEAYDSLATPQLLARWIADPSSAPGRQLSSPWPERIEIDAFVPAGGGLCRVSGRVIYVTSTDPAGANPAATTSVTLVLEADDEWRIRSYEAEPASESAVPAETAVVDTLTEDLADPAEVIRHYYAAINAKDYRQAYLDWGNEGAASRQSYAAFASGFAHTASVAVEVGDPGRMEGAAGSRYIEIPVVVRAIADDGATERFSGSYTLRRTVVDGSTPEQRRWHIDSARLEPSP